MAAALTAAGAPSPASIGLILSDDAELADAERDPPRPRWPDRRPVVPAPPARGVPAPPRRPGPRRRAARRLAQAFTGPPGRRVHLGDVVVSVERAAEQAVEGRGGQTGDVRWSVADELRLLVTHGTLHVCGWDHADPAEEREMRALEQRLLARHEEAGARWAPASGR